MRFAAAILLAVFSLAAGPPADAGEPESSPRLLVHLLDYLARDYGGAVSQGEIVSESEYREQIEFSESALKVGRSLAPRSPELERGLEELRERIASRADSQGVARLARALEARVIEVSGLQIAPLRWPDLARGRALFSESCVGCHGDSGAGDGVAAPALDPKPANLLDARMWGVSPFQVFNTIRLGVPRTAMAPFDALSDDDVWSLAFYVLALRYESERATAPPLDLTWDAETLRRAATLSDADLEKQEPRDADRERARIAALRTHSGEAAAHAGSLGIARAHLAGAVSAYEAGDFASARREALAAYLEGVEPIEPRLAASEGAAVSRLEERISSVRSVIEARGGASAVRSAVDAAQAEIDAADALLRGTAMSPWLAFAGAAAILLREGFEAVLVIIALLGVIRAAGSREAALWVHAGWITALGFGALAWVFSGWLVSVSGAQREALEGVTSLLAVAILLIAGFWLHSQTEIGRWTAFIGGKVQRALAGRNLWALAGRNLWALAATAFVAVFREAFETVLFLRAIWFEGSGDTKLAMSIGVFASLAAVIVLAWAVLRFSVKLPVRRLFGASAVIMALLAVVLAGKGVHALQETGAVSISSLPRFPLHSDLVGIYPTWETLACQGAVIFAVAALWKVGQRPTRSPGEAERARAPSSH